MKSKIRTQVLDARSRMSPAERRDRSARIEDRLFTLPEFRTASVVMFFASFQSEVETHDMIRRAIREGKRVVLPKVRGKELEIVEIGDYDADVRPGAWGIPEPDTGALVALKDIGLIIVPGAAFDERGNRIGYGAGFYDRLLPAYDGPTVALSFDAQIVPAVPADPHDVPVKRIVTETRTIEANPKF